MVVYVFLVVFFYTFLGLFLGNRVAEITVTTIFSFMVRLKKSAILSSFWEFFLLI